MGVYTAVRWIGLRFANPLESYEHLLMGPYNFRHCMSHHRTSSYIFLRLIYHYGLSCPVHQLYDFDDGFDTVHHADIPFSAEITGVFHSILSLA